MMVMQLLMSFGFNGILNYYGNSFQPSDLTKNSLTETANKIMNNHNVYNYIFQLNRVDQPVRCQGVLVGNTNYLNCWFLYITIIHHVTLTLLISLVVLVRLPRTRVNFLFIIILFLFCVIFTLLCYSIITFSVGCSYIIFFKQFVALSLN